MRAEQILWTPKDGWSSPSEGGLYDKAQLALIFFSKEAIRDHAAIDGLKRLYPHADIFGCSTAGEISDTSVFDNAIVATAISFDDTAFIGIKTKIRDMTDSLAAGEFLANSLEHKGLIHVFCLSDGLHINGSDLVKGLTMHLPPHVRVTGGLAGDGPDFKEALVCWDGSPEKDTVGILGFYGKGLKIAYGSFGGWDPFGPERLITCSKGNILYELDGSSALELYKLYLGEYAQNLPAMGLLFPLSIRTGDGKTGIVRTILSINEEDKGIIFAGDVPEGAYARFMKANIERLIDGSYRAAKTSYEAIGASPDLAILISCVGRKLVLKQRTEEEVEAAREVFGEKTVMTGFYSYGEIAPFTPNTPSILHNQTMTITTFFENRDLKQHA